MVCIYIHPIHLIYLFNIHTNPWKLFSRFYYHINIFNEIHNIYLKHVSVIFKKNIHISTITIITFYSCWTNKTSILVLKIIERSFTTFQLMLFNMIDITINNKQKLTQLLIMNTMITIHAYNC
jgi:hypothetical protein